MEKKVQFGSGNRGDGHQVIPDAEARAEFSTLLSSGNRLDGDKAVHGALRKHSVLRMQAGVLASLTLGILGPAGILEVAGVECEGCFLWLWEGKMHLKTPMSQLK